MKKGFFIIIAFSLLLTSLAFGADVRAIRVERSDVPDFVGYVPNEIVVKFDRSITTKIDRAKALKGSSGISPLLGSLASSSKRLRTEAASPQCFAQRLRRSVTFTRV